MPSATNLVRGDVLAGRYDILREIGSGGMGRVFEAYDRALKERVAVKVLKSAPDEESRSRFLNEVKLARRIRHRNVVGLHEYGEEGDVPYFCMEFVEGEDLRHLIRARTALDWEAAYALAEQIGAGLQAAHEMGVVHRDLKPANVMIEPSGQVRVMDFGVAKGGGEPGATQVGMVLGTPEYMSPEQVLASDVDARSDVYAFGVVIHEMFTGIVPFSGTSAPATMLMHIDTPLPFDPPHERLPGPLVPILRKALAKSRDDRYGSCAEMLEGLAAARRQQGTDPLPTPPGLGDSGKGATILSVPKVGPRLPDTAVPSEARLLLPMLTRALDSPQVEVRLGAIHALGLHGPASTAAIPRLESFLGDPAVGEAAALALRAIAPPLSLGVAQGVAQPSPVPSRSSVPGPTGGNALRAGPEEIQRTAATEPDLVTPLPLPGPRVREPAPPQETIDSRPPSESTPGRPDPPPAVASVPPPPVLPPQRVRQPPLVLGRSADRTASALTRRQLVAMILAGALVAIGLVYWLVSRSERPVAPGSVDTTTGPQPPSPAGPSSPDPQAVVSTTTTTTTTTSTTQPPRPTPSPIAKAATSPVRVTPASPPAATPKVGPLPTPEPTPTPEAEPVVATTTTSTTTTTTSTTYRPRAKIGDLVRGDDPDVVMPECDVCPRAPYPEIARDPRVAAEGRIEVRLLVDEEGGVAVLGAAYRPLPSRRPSPRPGQKILEDAAVAAVKKWRYRPATKDGVAVRMEVMVRLDFTLAE